ncbi:MAG: hypothetical protein EXX96DRAFT_652681 [Benjaminiella poitrasii]|nr:MAG: hypothetical protein EXX96DRAFT_652681 [Benjaminiella poitrasii]
MEEGCTDHFRTSDNCYISVRPINLVNINQVLEPSSIEGIIKPKFTKIRVQKSEWLNCLHEIEEACGVRWVAFKSNKLSEQRLNDKQRKLFSELRNCHCSGVYASVAKERLIQKETKKCNCRAQLKIECLVKHPLVFVLSFKNEHANHVPGDRATDLCTLPLARKRLAEIKERLTASPSMPARQLRIEILCNIDRYHRLSERKVNYLTFIT